MSLEDLSDSSLEEINVAVVAEVPLQFRFTIYLRESSLTYNKTADPATPFFGKLTYLSTNIIISWQVTREFFFTGSFLLKLISNSVEFMLDSDSFSEITRAISI